MADGEKTLVEKLFAAHRDALQSFFHRRIRTKPDAADLAQEVYLRLLRVKDLDAIRHPEAYLYTVASNLVKEHAHLHPEQSGAVDLDDPTVEQPPAEWVGSEEQYDAKRRVVRLREVLAQLPPKCRAAVVLQYHYGLSYQEIAGRLEISPHMVKKYLGQALSHCRRRMARLG